MADMTKANKLLERSKDISEQYGFNVKQVKNNHSRQEKYKPQDERSFADY